MKFLFIILSTLVVFGCSTTPNNEQQMTAVDKRQELIRHKQWCRDNDGVFVENDIKPNKCYRREDFNAAVRNANVQGGRNESSDYYITHDGLPSSNSQ